MSCGKKTRSVIFPETGNIFHFKKIIPISRQTERHLRLLIPALAAGFLFMATNLSSHFRRQRLDLNLRPGQVAKLLGYTSLVGAANKIVRLEEGGDVDYRFFKKLAAVLGIERATILRLMEQDRRELIVRWTEWANQPIAPNLIAWLLPG